jgi:hypothetical protein
MKITEMNNCIEKMRECYPFEDDKTEICLNNRNKVVTLEVCLRTKDLNGTEIEMTRPIDSLERDIIAF